MIRVLVALFIILAAMPSAAGCGPNFGEVDLTFVGSSIRKITTANINGDSYPDLVVARVSSEREGGLTLLLGQPDGSWVHAALVGTPEGTTAGDAIALDFDGDGDDDIAWTEREDNNVVNLRVLRNDGGVRLTETASFEIGGETGLAGGDLNGDDRDDLVHAGDGDSHLFLSLGDGTFEEKTFGENLDVPSATGDLDGDGRDEVLTGGPDGPSRGNLFIFPGTTDGLGAPRTISLPFRPQAIAVGDFDGDGRIDATVSYTLFYVGSGLPYSTPFYDIELVSDVGSATATLKRIPLTVPTTNAAVADIDGDGRDDLLNPALGGVNVIAGQADGLALGAGYYASAGNGVVAADFDADGDVDVATAGFDTITLLRNDGTGSLGDQRFAAIALDIADFNGDGRDDLLDATGVRVAGPGGTFTRSTETLQDVFTRPLVPWAAAADVNGDGKLDSVLQRIVPNRPTKLEVRLGNGDGTLQPATVVLEYFNVPREGTVVDLNADGRRDIVVTEVSGATHVVYGNGDGTFQSPAGSVPDGDEVELGDFNGDGRLDVLTVSRPAVNVALGTSPPGGFGPTTKITETLTAVATGDFDGDGRTDFVTTQVANAKTAVRVFFGRADGTFEEKTFDGGPREYRGILVADLNADGRLDIMLAGAVRRLLGGRPDRAFLGVDVESTHGGIPLQAGDFNGDGRTDLLDGGFVRLNRCARRRATRP